MNATNEIRQLRASARRLIEHATLARHPATKSAYRAAALTLRNAADLIEKELEEGKP